MVLSLSVITVSTTNKQLAENCNFQRGVQHNHSLVILRHMFMVSAQETPCRRATIIVVLKASVKRPFDPS
jgi:hypothetical protein